MECYILFLKYVPLLIGLGAIVIGAGASLFPGPASKGFGISASGNTLPYVRATGVRDIFIGCTFLYLFSRSAVEEIVAVCIFTGIVSGSDFLITRTAGSKLFSSFHLAATVAVLFYALILFKSLPA